MRSSLHPIARFLPSLLLFPAAVPPARAAIQVVVTAPHTVIPPGQYLQCRAQVEGAKDTRVRWSLEGPGGSLSENGRFAAPLNLAAPLATFVIRATSVEDPTLSGRISVDVTTLPILGENKELADAGLAGVAEGAQLHSLFKAIIPEAIQPSWALRDRPFLDAESGQRYLKAVRVAETRLPAERHTRGAGETWGLLFPEGTRDAEAALLSYEQQDGWTRLDVTGQPSQVMRLERPLGRAQLEILDRDKDGAWSSKILPLEIRINGLTVVMPPPAAEEKGGDAAAAPTLCLATVATNGQTVLLAAEDGGSAIYRIGDLGQRTLLCGSPQAGHADGRGGSAAFHAIRFMAAMADGTPAVLVSDRHALRRVTLDGRVETLAGAAEAGCLDSPDGAQARFDTIMGVAAGPGGHVYVADRGNRRIRRITAQGEVTTVAAAPAPDPQGGADAEATFADLKGMAYLGGRLLVADGACVREVVLDPDAHGDDQVRAGQVLRVLGRPGVSGFTAHALREPDGTWDANVLMNDPYAILAHGCRALIADRGNHVVQAYHVSGTSLSAGLSTVVGDPSGTTLRAGLLRADGYPGTSCSLEAAFPAPASLARVGPGITYVAGRGGLARLDETPGPFRDEVDLLMRFNPQDELEIVAGVPQAIDFEFRPEEGVRPEAPPAWWVEVRRLGADGPAEVVQAAQDLSPATFAGRVNLVVDQPGHYQFLIRWLPQGGKLKFDAVDLLATPGMPAALPAPQVP